MGTYNLSVEEFKPLLEEFLGCVEGQVHSEVMAEAWNQLADKNMWLDRLKAFDLTEEESK